MRYPKNTKLPHREDYADPERVFHLTFRTHPEVISLTQRVADATWASVLEQRHSSRVELFAACLMPDHLHLLISPRDQGILTFSAAMEVMDFEARARRRTFRTQPGMLDRACRDQDDLETTATCIVRNPVEANLVEDERDWPWTWCWWWDDA